MRNNETIGLKSAGNGGAFAPNKTVENAVAVTEPTSYWNDVPLSMDAQTVERLGGAEAAMHIDTITGILDAHARFECPDNGAGACVYATAAATFYLVHEAGINQDVKAHQGAYDGKSHWWASVNGIIVDPTRCQFDDGPMVSEDPRYVAEQEFPAGWTSRELVAAEAARSYGHPAQGYSAVEGIFGEIDECLQTISETEVKLGA